MNAMSDLDARTALDADLAALQGAKTRWARTPVAERIKLLRAVKDATTALAEGWVEIDGRKKGLPAGDALLGESWLTGPYTVIAACDALITTLEGLEGHRYLRKLPKRYTPSGQLAVTVHPNNLLESMLFSGVKAEVWMEKGVTEVDLPGTAATAYSVPEADRQGAVVCVLGAGNVASIPPLDAFYKLFAEHKVVLLKLNPVISYLTDYMRGALRPLIDAGVLRVVDGDGAVGAYLTNHDAVEELHITGAEATHDLIVWGQGAEAAKRKAAGTPLNARPITSELGAVCPTIVVPGPWSREDIAFQAENLATQKLQNGGYNCIACQALIMPGDWSQGTKLLAATERLISRNRRHPYYPGTVDRLNAMRESADGDVTEVARGDAPDALIFDGMSDQMRREEVFGPAMGVIDLPGEGLDYLRAAIRFANEELHGTLGASIIIHPKTLAAIGKREFDAALAELRYGTIGVNIWQGLGFPLPNVPWGAFPGHTLGNVQSGIGVVHNAMLFDRSERTVITGSFAPMPRSWKQGEWHLMPRPIWFITHKRAQKVGRLVVDVVGRNRLWKLGLLAWHALRG